MGPTQQCRLSSRPGVFTFWTAPLAVETVTPKYGRDHCLLTSRLSRHLLYRPPSSHQLGRSGGGSVIYPPPPSIMPVSINGGGGRLHRHATNGPM